MARLTTPVATHLRTLPKEMPSLAARMTRLRIISDEMGVPFLARIATMQQGFFFVPSSTAVAK
jgi:hypothetical protein